MATARRPQRGQITTGHSRPHRARPATTGPKAPQTIFARSDRPFQGSGTEVALVAEPGYTKSGYLSVAFRMQHHPIDQWQRTSAYAWSSYDVLGGSDNQEERIQGTGPRLDTVAFKTMFTTWNPEWVAWEADTLEPILAVNELVNYMRLGLIFRLKIRNSALYGYDDVNMLAVITQAQTTEVAGEPDTRYLDLSFQQWKATQIEQMSVKNQLGPWTHKIVAGDTLYKLARDYYRRQSDWPVISAVNPGLEHQPPSGDLVAWARKRHKSSIRIPSKPRQPVQIQSSDPATGAVIVGGRTFG